MFASVARFQRHGKIESKSIEDTAKHIHVKHVEKVDQVSSHYNQSYASSLHGGVVSKPERQDVVNKIVSLSDDELVQVTNSMEVVLVKIKNVETMSNLYLILNEEGFDKVNIHYIGVKVIIHGEEYDVHIHELGAWNIDIEDSDSYNYEAGSKVEEDFDNENESERHGSEFLQTQTHIFNLSIEVACLFDIPLGGCMFTWMNKAGTKMSKLDRFLVSHLVMDSSPDFKVTALLSGWSDHTPLLLHYEKDDNGSVPFKFFHSWLKRDGFNECIVNTYSECSQEVSRMHEVRSRLNVIDGKIDYGIASAEEKHERLNLIKEYDYIQEPEEMNTTPKARVKWDIERDENSKFFHWILKQKKTLTNVQGKWVHSDKVFYMMNIYGPQEPSEKTSLRNRLLDFIANHDGQYVIFCDFNEVQNESERHGSEFLQTQTHIFNLSIEVACLFDIPLGGCMFTWMNKAGTKMSKLDRFLVSHLVMDSSPDFKVTALLSGWSDHTPLLLHYEKDDNGSVPFKFFHSWLKRDGFNECIVNTYSECSQEVSRMHEVRSRLNVIDGKIDYGIASAEEKHERLNLIKEYDYIQEPEEMNTTPKARVKWDIERDENSKFFHWILKQKKTLTNGER
nr:RNA-directed DNA polymerase, eukaryota, reverse transcriptase zinc-binding domain protein [Tanacetum cinerariifolium]